MRTAKVLIVEDERIIALDLARRLATLGYLVVGSAASGEAAMEIVQRHDPDIVLMDVHLEGEQDGTEVAKLIQQRHATPVIFLTAYAENDTLARALGSLPFAYLIKPVNTQDLHAAMQTALARRESETALHRSEQRLKLALDAAGMGVWEWHPASGQFSTGGLFGDILGPAPDAMNEGLQRFLERIHVDEQARARAVMERALADVGTVSESFRYASTAGRSGWLEIHARVHDDPTGPRLVGVIKDVTQRRVMEEAMRTSAAVFETVSEGLFTLDAQGRFTSANPAFVRLTGYTLDEILGRDPDDFLHARRHSDQFDRRLVARQAGHWQGEAWCREKGGEFRSVWESIRVVRDPEGGVDHYVASIADITPLRRAEEKINHLAYHDPLTGLPNRMLFLDRLDRTMESAARNASHCAVLFIDLDGFKSINDTLGHAIGDSMLQTVAGRLQSTLRSTDTVARMGGDEFVVILTDLNHGESAPRIADKLLAALSTPMDLGGERVAITGSIGIAVYPGDGADREALMRAADTAMYSAKAHGKNQACAYAPELTAQAAERMQLEQGLRHALERGDFMLHYQPQFSLPERALIGVEALLRWRHPRRGMISPAVFIPIAEECGLIGAIGAWVLRAACVQVGAWILGSGVPLRLSVNVSARQMRNGEILAVLRDTLSETHFPPSCLEVEITESTLQSIEDSRVLLRQIRDLGIQIAIDDFGTGYSSLSVLKHLPLDSLKVDQSFVRGLPHDRHDVGIVEAILTVTHTLGLKSIAEGVETEEQLNYLLARGCGEVQGYLTGRPVPWQDLVPQLGAARPDAAETVVA
ncbi:MAG: hypothetical protein RIQ60_2130 [Pseudomonadota bacterium]|jgi:diguanylate cyclase (GGDEF)-like protein/PAS domain S-box-containing protein